MGSRAKRPYEIWLDCYGVAFQNPRLVSQLACPHCGKRRLQLVYLVDDLDAERGAVAFWCNACLKGIGPERTLVPMYAEKVIWGTETIPNYSLVIDEGDG